MLLFITNSQEQENLADSEERNEQLIKAKQKLETEISELTEKLDFEIENNEKYSENKRKLEKLNEEISQDLESAEGSIKRLGNEKHVSKSHFGYILVLQYKLLKPYSYFLNLNFQELERKVRNLSSELDSKDEIIATLQKEKKYLEQSKQQTLDDLQVMEDKTNHLSKLKVKLESQIENVSCYFFNYFFFHDFTVCFA